MQKRRKLQQQLWVAGCASVILASSGCRSAMPKWNLLSSRNTPSAETLAGTGPSITYPAPPSESATPDAIASVAGGTADPASPDAIIASNDPTAPMTAFGAPAASVASATNDAAARANGFGTTGTPAMTASTGSNSNVPAIPVGYQFGTRGSAPATSSAPSGSVSPSSYPMPGSASSSPSGAPTYTLPAATTAPPATTTPPASGFQMPSTTPTASAGTPAPGGFAMPNSMLDNVKSSKSAQLFTPKAESPSATMPVPSGALADIAPPQGMALPKTPAALTPAQPASAGEAAASFSTASAALTPRPSEIIESAPDGSIYAPGSTAGAGAYPTTSGYPNTGTDGSFYR